MIDIEKAIKEVEEKQGIRFTEDQREAAKGFGMFLNSFWGNVTGNSSCDDEVKKTMNREKVMSWLEGLAESDWRDFHSDSEVQNIAKSALELLNEQEAVEPKKTAYQRVDHTIACRYRCGTCDMSIFPSYKYCPFCGQAVKWDD